MLELAAMCAARASASRRSEAQRGSTGTCKARAGRFFQHAFVHIRVPTPSKVADPLWIHGIFAAMRLT